MKFVATYTPTILLTTLFLVFLPSIIHAGIITVDWSEVDCVTTNTDPTASASDDMEPCHGKLRTYQGEYLQFINGSGETYLYDDEESWNECNDNKTLVDSDVFDSWPDEGPVQGAQLFALNENCGKRFKAIFHGKGKGKGKNKVTCSATTETVSASKKCHKECRDMKECIGLKVSGRGNDSVCTLFSGEMFVVDTDEKPSVRCLGLKTNLKKNRHIVLSE